MQFDNFIQLTNFTGTTIATALTVLAVAIKVSQQFGNRRNDEVITVANEAPKPAPPLPLDPLQPVLDRLLEAKSLFKKQKAAATANRWMSGLLTVGQYIVGGLLASSFVQQSVSRDVVGALGLLVLFSSLIHQHFRPDLQLRGAMSRAFRLQGLIREVEDDMLAITAGDASAPSIAVLRRKISASLSQIEASELQDSSSRSSADFAAPSPKSSPRGKRPGDP